MSEIVNYIRSKIKRRNIKSVLTALTFEGEASGGGTWGSITGTLSNQTDLQSALDAKLVKTNNLSDLSNAATARTNLGATTVGSNVFTVTNPDAVRFFRVNADNTVTLLDAASFLSAIGGGASSWGAISGTITDQTDLVSYVSSQIASGVAGLMDYRGVYDASVNSYPSSGGSGTAGAILKSDFWIVSVAGTLPTGLVVSAGDLIIAKQDTPGNTQSNWSLVEYNIGYTAENSANKDTDSTFASNSDTKYPSQKAVKTALDLKANLASPTFTGTPAAPTAAVNTNTTQIATTAFVQTQIAAQSTAIGNKIFLYNNFI